MLSLDLESTGDSTALGLVYELRPWQWYKQLLLYMAVVFSGAAGDLNAWLRVSAGAILFSGVVGGTYILNDISDIEKDRKHPRKQHRPIASGQVSVRPAIVVAGLLYGVSGYLSWRLDPLFFGLIALYVGQNFIYSYGPLKQYLFVDLFSISAGFVIRAIAGIVLISAILSPWIVLCTFLAALMLSVSKRWGEREEFRNPNEIRENLDTYTKQTLQFLFTSVATTLMMAYSLYTFFTHDINMMLTIPFAFYAVFRFAHLTFVKDGGSQPLMLLLDRPLLINFVLWGASIIGILYKGMIL